MPIISGFQEMNSQTGTFMKLYLYSLIMFLVLSCTKPVPQLPSNKGNTADTVSGSLLKINKKLTIYEDSVITELVKIKYADFTKSNLGFWYKTEKSSTKSLLKSNDKCTVNYSLSTLNGKKLIQKKTTITIGKKEIITGIEECLKLISKGDKATVIIPWYLAYGLNGNNSEIEPYTSVIAELFVSEQ
jgi:hypothetical protein